MNQSVPNVSRAKARYIHRIAGKHQGPRNQYYLGWQEAGRNCKDGGKPVFEQDPMAKSTEMNFRYGQRPWESKID